MALTAGARLGRYEIVEQIGRGGMATVYKALQTGLDRYVALKVLPAHLAGDPQFGERFQREAVLIANLRHPNILTIFDYGSDDGYTYIVSELVEGGTLSQRLGRPLGTARASALLAPIADALDYAHERGIVHRDVKPSNILLAADGRPVLSDFGIARMLDNSSGLTLVGKVVGTPAYMAPEQARGQPADSAVDRYALGVVAYQVLVGRVPFVAETTQAMLYAQVSQPPPPPRGLNPAIGVRAEAALLRMLAKSPGERFPTAHAFLAALSAGETWTAVDDPVTIHRRADGGPTVATEWPAARPARLGQPPAADTRPVPPATEPPRGPRTLHGRMRRNLLLGVGGGILLALGLAGGRFVWFRPRGREGDDGADTPVAGPGGGPVRGPAVTGSPLSILPPVTPQARITDSNTPAPRVATMEPAPSGSPPPGAGLLPSTAALPPLAAWARSGSPSGSWNVNQAGVVTARVTDGNSMLLAPQIFRDVEIFAEVSTPNREASLALRIDADLNGYLAVYMPDGAAHLKGRNGRVAIVRVTGGVRTPLGLGRLPALVQVRDTVRMRLLARDQQLILFLNGREIARASDGTYPEGRVGLSVFADADGPCDATFANVRVGLV